MRAFYTAAASVVAGMMIAGCEGGGASTGPGPLPEGLVVSMPGNAFSPFNAIIKVNGTVSWEFPSDEHDVVFVQRDGAPANIPVTTKATVTRKFTRAGVFPYDCRVHPGMTGQVTVNE